MSLAMKILSIEIPYAVQITTETGVHLHILDTSRILDQEIRRKLESTKMRLTFEEKVKRFTNGRD